MPWLHNFERSEKLMPWLHNFERSEKLMPRLHNFERSEKLMRDLHNQFYFIIFNIFFKKNSNEQCLESLFVRIYYSILAPQFWQKPAPLTIFVPQLEQYDAAC